MLPLFFSGLLSYLVGMKRGLGGGGGAVGMSQARETTLTFFAMYLRFTFWLSFFCYMLPLFFSGLLSYLASSSRRTSSRVTYKTDHSIFLRYVLISPEAEILFRP